MNYGVMYNPALSGEIRVPVEGMAKMPLDERKVIARRAAFELPPNGVVNLGVGAPEGIAAVANEEKFTPYITLTTEAGAIGGVLASGSSFGGASNADSIIQQNQQFDFYDGGGLDMTCLGMAECDVQGNVNTSKFGGRLNGCGGFINISQNARSVVFAGTFTNGGLDVVIEDGKVKIIKEGRNTQIPELRRADHLLRQIRAKAQAAGDLRDGALRVPAPAQGTGANRGRARNRHREGYFGAYGLQANHQRAGVDGSPHSSSTSRWGFWRNCSTSTCTNACNTIRSAIFCS